MTAAELAAELLAVADHLRALAGELVSPPPPDPGPPAWAHGPVSIAWHQLSAPTSGLDDERLTNTVQFQALIDGGPGP